jgi:predicted Zn-dependent peptidase
MTDKIQDIAEQMGELLVKLTHVNIEIRIGYVEFQQKQKKLTKQLLQELSKLDRICELLAKKENSTIGYENYVEFHRKVQKTIKARGIIEAVIKANT